MKAMKMLGVVAVALGFVQVAHADDIRRCGRNVDCLERIIERAQDRIREIEGAAGTRRTTSGHVFTRDHSLAALGDAWRDESGMIWGDIARNDDGSIHYMKHYQAVEYCQNIRAELPSRADFERLRSYMGATEDSSNGYTPQALPNLYRMVNGRPQSYYFWSSSVLLDASYAPSYDAYFFDGRDGVIDYASRDYGDDGAVRCVRR